MGLAWRTKKPCLGVNKKIRNHVRLEKSHLMSEISARSRDVRIRGDKNKRGICF